MDKKITPVEFKGFDDSEGTGSAVFATMEVIDKDGDWTEKGAFGEQNVKLVGAHDWAAPPIGTARIREDGKSAIADFRFNLKMSAGREWYESVKASSAAGVPQEFSYGFDIKEKGVDTRASEVGAQRVLKSLNVFEVSPVMVGAGRDTRLLGIKSPTGQTMTEEFNGAVSVLDKFLERAEDLVALRKQEGKGDGLTVVMRERLAEIKRRLDLMAGLEAGSADLSMLDAELAILESSRGRRASGG